jgi:hypothetical protein
MFFRIKKAITQNLAACTANFSAHGWAGHRRSSVAAAPPHGQQKQIKKDFDMIYRNRQTTVFGRFWQFVLEASEVAIAIRYASPWRR